jgi:hypothetical protein
LSPEATAGGGEGLSAYAEAHGLLYRPQGGLGTGPPLLRRGDRRRVEGRADGQLSKNVKGTLAHLTVGEVVKQGRYGNKRRSWTPYTVALTKVPRAQPFLPQLICRPRFGLQALEGVEDALLNRGRRRIELESAAFDDRWEVFASDEHDANWLRQLFSPTFIVWLTEEPPEGFSFEYEGGVLLANLEGHRRGFDDLDGLRKGLIGVTRAMREQVVERLGRVKRPPAG